MILVEHAQQVRVVSFLFSLPLVGSCSSSSAWLGYPGGGLTLLGIRACLELFKIRCSCTPRLLGRVRCL